VTITNRSSVFDSHITQFSRKELSWNDAKDHLPTCFYPIVETF